VKVTLSNKFWARDLGGFRRNVVEVQQPRRRLPRPIWLQTAVFKIDSGFQHRCRPESIRCNTECFLYKQVKKFGESIGPTEWFEPRIPIPGWNLGDYLQRLQTPLQAPNVCVMRPDDDSPKTKRGEKIAVCK
jgi:hypothetical protein